MATRSLASLALGLMQIDNLWSIGDMHVKFFMTPDHKYINKFKR
jgi:hypothetical protein